MISLGRASDHHSPEVAQGRRFALCRSHAHRPRTAAIAAIALAACSKTAAPVSSAFTLHYHARERLLRLDGAVASGAVETSAASSTKDGFGAIYR